jgi:hypothetical protein
MMNLKVALLFCIFSTVHGLPSGNTQKLRIAISVKQATWVRCQEPLGLKLLLEARLRNLSRQSVSVGRLEIGQERVYHERDSGKLERIGTTNTPDDFGQGVPLKLADIRQGQTGREAETMLGSEGQMRFTISHYVYFPSKYVQHRGNQRNLLVSFHVINVLQDGSNREYWTGVTTIHLPPQSQCFTN